MSIYRYINPRLRARILAGDEPEYVTKNPRAQYIRQCVISAPPWCDRERVRQMMLEARRLTLATGIPHVLDHDIPLNHWFVCGLTVPDNLRVVAKPMNDRKGNKLHMLVDDLFAAPEQLALL